jgi:hypothetical protein
MKLIIGAPVQINTPKNEYELVISHMHGDADAYTESKYTFDDLESSDKSNPSLAELLTVIQIASDAGYEFFENRFTRSDTLKEQGFSDDFIDEITDFMVCDCTNDNSYAQFDGYELFYYDKNGTKFNVTVEE